MKNKLSSKIVRWGAFLVCVILLMCVSYAVSYKIIRNNAPSENSERASGIKDKNSNYEKPFPNLPVTISGTYEENKEFVGESFDYLVISENNLVNLYVIDKDDKKTFERILEIDPAALKKEDQELLKKGIILNDKSDVLSLIEDYSS